MLRQCFILNTGILFHKNQFKNIGLDPETLYPHVLPRPPLVHYSPDSLASRFDPPLNYAKNYEQTVKHDEPFINEEEEDMLDALAPIYDQLKMAKGWWALEVLPSKQRYQKEDDTWAHATGYAAAYSYNLSRLLMVLYPRAALTMVALASSPSRRRRV